MKKHTKHEAAIPNPALQALSGLIGEWNIVGSHPSLSGALHGHASFTWLEGGAFLTMHSEIDEPGVPSGISIFGSDDATGEFFMLYFDERGVSRKYDVSLRGNVLTFQRMVPKFSQRFTGTLRDNGDTIAGVWELNEDDVTWKRDLELTYTRVK